MNILRNKINLLDKKANLAIIRPTFYLLFLYFISIEWFLSYSNYPPELYLPQGVFKALHSPIGLSLFQIEVLKYTWSICALLAALNIYYKVSSVIFFIITFLAFNISHNYGYQTHTYMPLVLASAAMAFGGKNKVFLVKFVFCSVFFMAGMSKLRNSGLDWIFSDNLQNILVRSKIFYHDIHQIPNKLNLNYLIAKNLLFTQIIAFFTVAVEVAAPIALIRSRWSKMVVLLLFLMQLGIYFTIFVNFKVYALLYIFWIDWRKVNILLKRKLGIFFR